MGSKANSQQATVHWPRGNHQSQAKFFFIHIFLLNNGKREKREIWAGLGKLGQVWKRQQIKKMGKKAERIRKEKGGELESRL